MSIQNEFTLKTLSDAEKWDANAQTRLQELASNSDPAYRALMHKAAEVLGQHVSLESDVLDVGCGLGFLSAYLIKQGYRVTAIDPSKESIRLAKMHHADVPANTFVASDLHQFAKSSEHTYDAIVANMTLHSVRRLQTFFIDARRLLSDSGIIYASFPNPRTYLKTHTAAGQPPLDLLTTHTLARDFKIRGHQAHPSQVPFFHYPVRDYVTMAATAGLRIKDFDIPSQIGAGVSGDITVAVFEVDVPVEP